MNHEITRNALAPSRSRQLLNSVRDDLRDRRQARAEHRALERELSAYTTRSDVDDLLAAMKGQEGQEVERIRGVLTANLEHHQRKGMLAS